MIYIIKITGNKSEDRSFGLSHVVWLLGQRKSSKSHLSLPISSAASLFLRKNHWFPSVSTVLEISWLQLKRYSEFQKSISKSNPAMQFFFFWEKIDLHLTSVGHIYQGIYSFPLGFSV